MTQAINDLYARAKDLSRNVDDHFFDLARTLRQLLDRDPEKFNELWQVTELGRRKAYYMVEIARAYEGLSIPRSRLKKVGWTKLQLIGKRVTAQNWEELFDLAEKFPAKQLEKLMKGGQPVENAHCVVMYMTPEQYRLFEAAVLANGGERSGRGLLRKEEAIARVIEKAGTGSG